MNKITESLKKMPLKEYILHEHISDTYFYQKPRKRKYNRTITKNIKTALIVSLFFAAVFISIIIFSYFYNSYYVKFAKAGMMDSKVINIFSDGRLNARIIKKFEFGGSASKNNSNSKIANRLIILNSPEKYNWADAAIDFKFPIDVSKRNLSISFKGEIGGERINIVLKDENNRTCRLNNMYLTSAWRAETISFDGIKEDIDLSKITHLRFEFGYIGESDNINSPIDVTIYLKEMKITKFP